VDVPWDRSTIADITGRIATLEGARNRAAKLVGLDTAKALGRLSRELCSTGARVVDLKDLGEGSQASATVFASCVHGQ
jgi:hypothetical protein